MKKIVHIVGARPNFMKAAPVWKAIDKLSLFKQILIHTGQHYDSSMSDIFFSELNLPKPDFNLNIGSDTHARQTAAIMVKLDNAETLSEIERERFEQYMTRYLNMWELAHDRYVEGLFSEGKWLGWSDALGSIVTQGPRRLPKESWDVSRVYYGPEFASIVDDAYSMAE